MEPAITPLSLVAVSAVAVRVDGDGEVSQTEHLLGVALCVNGHDAVAYVPICAN